jgi:hypothetical protein
MHMSETVFGIDSTEKIYDYDSVRTTILESIPRPYYSTSTGTSCLAGVIFVLFFMNYQRASKTKISHFRPSLLSSQVRILESL